MKPSHPSPKRLLSIKNGAGYMGCGVYTIRQKIWNGEIPIFRDGRKIYLDIRDLDSHIEKNKTTYSMRPEDARPENGRKKGD